MMSSIDKARMLFSFVRLIRNPDDTGAAFAMAEVGIRNRHRYPDLARAVEDRLMDTEGFRMLYEARYVPKLPSLKALACYQEGTLGNELFRFYDSNGFDPDFYEPHAECSDVLTFAENVVRSTHDIWHVVTGIGRDIPGELGLQAFSIAQLNTSLSLVLIAAGLLKLAETDPSSASHVMHEIMIGYQMGLVAKPLIGVNWPEYLDWDLGRVRQELGFAA